MAPGLRSRAGTAPRMPHRDALTCLPPRQDAYAALRREGPDVFSRHDADGRFLEASPAVSGLLGRDPSALSSLTWLDIVDQQDRDRVAAWWRLLRSGPQPPLSFRVGTPDGAMRWVEAAAVAARGHDGHLAEVQVLTRDVTGHLGRIEEARRRADRLEQANRELGAFAADVAHDMKSPLQAISGFAELLARREGARLDETSQRFVARILSATSGIQELVHAVLEHRRSTSAVLERRPLDCGTLVRTVLRQLQHDIDDSGAEVEIGDLPLVVADRVQLGRVFQNLIANALRTTPPPRRPKVSITARRLTGQWELSVADNGVGVPDEDRHRIFELFQRGEPTRDGHSGHGLGLPICRAVVERHGGRIGVERIPGGGSRFFFTVPDHPIPGAAGERPGRP